MIVFTSFPLLYFIIYIQISKLIITTYYSVIMKPTVPNIKLSLDNKGKTNSAVLECSLYCDRQLAATANGRLKHRNKFKKINV